MKHHTESKVTPSTWQFQAYLPTDCIVCYHNNCLDGILAGGYAYQSWQGTTKHDGVAYLLPITYGGRMPFDPAQHPGAHVIFVDFCPTTDDLKELLKYKLDCVTVYDHHKTGVDNARRLAQEFQDLDTLTNIKFNFDMERSGTGLVASIGAGAARGAWFKTDERQLIETAERYDLWKHNGKLDTDENYLANSFSVLRRAAAGGYKVASEKTDYRERLSALTGASLNLYSDLKGTSFKDLISSGKKESARLMKEADDLLNTVEGVPHVPVAGRSFLLIEAKGEMVPLLVARAHEKEPELNLIVTYQKRDTGFKLSLRCGPKAIFDMTQVAKALDPNGGGHLNAAGATVQMSKEDLIETLYDIVDPRRKAVDGGTALPA